MKLNVELLSCLKYISKTTGKEKVRLSYRVLDRKFSQNGSKMKGFAELFDCLDNVQIFDKLTPDHFGIACELDCEEQISPYNPTRKILVLKSLKFGNDNISLL